MGSLSALTHLAVQCVRAVFAFLKSDLSITSWLHILSFLLYSVFKVPPAAVVSAAVLRLWFRCLLFGSDAVGGGGLKWTRTTDLTLIRRAL